MAGTEVEMDLRFVNRFGTAGLLTKIGLKATTALFMVTQCPTVPATNYLVTSGTKVTSVYIVLTDQPVLRNNNKLVNTKRQTT